MKKISFVHDRTFKNAMADNRVARDFFEHNLPENLKALLNLDTLKKSPKSYVDDTLSEYSSDILYAVDFMDPLDELTQDKNTKRKKRRFAYLYLLCEHRTSVDPLMPYRVWHYVFRIWSDYIKESDHKTQILPLVFPIVFYNGKKAYDGFRNLRDLIQAPADMVENTLFKDFNLVDTYDIKDQVLREQRWAGILTFMFKHVYDRDIWPLVQMLREMIGAIEQEPGGTSYTKVLLQYWILLAESSKGTHAFIEAVQESVSLPTRSELMSMATQLIEEGREEGERIGWEKGQQLGQKVGESTFLLRLLKHKFGVIPIKYLQQIETADEKQLLHWGERLLEVKALAQLFENSCATMSE